MLQVRYLCHHLPVHAQAALHRLCPCFGAQLDLDNHRSACRLTAAAGYTILILALSAGPAGAAAAGWHCKTEPAASGDAVAYGCDSNGALRKPSQRSPDGY